MESEAEEEVEDKSKPRGQFIKEVFQGCIVHFLSSLPDLNLPCLLAQG